MGERPKDILAFAKEPKVFVKFAYYPATDIEGNRIAMFVKKDVKKTYVKFTEQNRDYSMEYYEQCYELLQDYLQDNPENYQIVKIREDRNSDEFVIL